MRQISGYPLKAGLVKPFVVSLSNHERLTRSPFDKLSQETAILWQLKQ
ncbi:MAG: hypothetical protein NTX45_02320 [Proteobacteria bacterium]|nr:hypothetical protein [Pseudomonadota bacterium]